MIFDERPMFTLSLSMAEMITIRDALIGVNAVSEANYEHLAAWLAANSSQYDVAVRDRLAQRVEDEFMPAARARLAEVMRAVEERRGEDPFLLSD